MLHEWLVDHHRLEARYWWFVNKRRIVRRLMASHLPTKGHALEVGCGGGFFASTLQADGWDVVGTDRFFDGARYAKTHGVAKALAFDGDVGWPLATNTFDAVIMLDVLEHIENDVHALMETRRVLRPGGAAVISVPAYPALFSSWDELNGHYRRYSARRLGAAAEAAGLHAVYTTYWNAVSLLPAVWDRLRERLGAASRERLEYPPVPPWLNHALTVYGRVETSWLAIAPVPAGLSVATVLRAPESA